ncbi:Anti-sigma-B factor antagonist [Phycisphaerae bacterium RAS1]|nr:Anti-sigma-B factor antagonist [Phycisphaerae bacterium RAS1]
MSESLPELEVTVEDAAGTRTVVVRGDIDLNTSPELRDRFLALLETPAVRLIVDLAGVKYIDSSGVGTIVELRRKTERAGGKLVLCGLQPRVRDVFDITHLSRLFNIAVTQDEARRL